MICGGRLSGQASVHLVQSRCGGGGDDTDYDDDGYDDDDGVDGALSRLLFSFLLFTWFSVVCLLQICAI